MISVENLSVEFAARPLFQGVSFVVNPKDRIALVGKNGAGKSTLFATLLYGLYGQLSNKVKAENIANRYLGDKEVRVAVYLDLDGKTYKAASGLNKRAQGYFNLFRI